MALSVQELVAALPADLESEILPENELTALIRAIGERPVPTSVVHRLWIAGSLQAKIALGYLLYWIRSGFAAQHERERLLNETRLRAAVRIFAGMSYLRGIAIKLGQTLANYPNVLPAEFADLMGRLNFEAPPMHFALLREQVRSELGGEPENIFAEFEPRAMAAASLGQVHRAILKDGRAVAVKVQYPGIGRTIDSDISTILTLLAPMRLTAEWDNIRRVWADIRAMLKQEADYMREAEFLVRARSVFRPDEGIVIPEVHHALTTSRILTMEFLDGVHLDEYLKTYRSQEERDRYGELIMRASFRIAHTGRLWYADSNPGNYLFLRDGRLGVIDFGCCREFTSEEWTYYTRMGRAQIRGGDALRDELVKAVGMESRAEVSEEHMRLLEDMSHWYSDYLQFDGPFDFGNEAFIRRGVELIDAVMRKRLLFTLPLNTWISRQLIGLRAIAFRLGARINMKRLCDEETGDDFRPSAN